MRVCGSVCLQVWERDKRFDTSEREKERRETQGEDEKEQEDEEEDGEST